MKKIFFAGLIVLLSSFCLFAKEPTLTPQKALQRLIEGNRRYMNDQSQHPNRNQERRKEIASKQYPYAVIVGCSDSRVAPEIICDEGLGDLFVVRVAGNVIGPIELDSIDYAALYLKSVIILVLGHERCGAIETVIKKQTADIEDVAKLIDPAVKEAREAKTNDILESAIKINALNMKNLIENSASIKPLIKDEKIEVHAGYYNFKTGLIELLKESNK